MKRAILALTASLTLLSAEVVQAQTSRYQPVRRTTTKSWHRTTTTRGDTTGRHAGYQQGKHRGWNKQVADTSHVHYGGYHRQRPPR